MQVNFHKLDANFLLENWSNVRIESVKIFVDDGTQLQYEHIISTYLAFDAPLGLFRSLNSSLFTDQLKLTVKDHHTTLQGDVYSEIAEQTKSVRDICRTISVTKFHTSFS